MAAKAYWDDAQASSRKPVDIAHRLLYRPSNIPDKRARSRDVHLPTTDQDLHTASLELVSVVSVKQKLLDSEKKNIAAGSDDMQNYNLSFKEE